MKLVVLSWRGYTFNIRLLLKMSYMCLEFYIWEDLFLGVGWGYLSCAAAGFIGKPSPNCHAYMSAELGVRKPNSATVQWGGFSRSLYLLSFRVGVGLRTLMTLNLLTFTDNS